MTRLMFPLLLSLALASPVHAQLTGDGGESAMAALRAELAPGKQVFIARQMSLDPAEEAAFWPLYDDHQAGLADLAERRSRVVDEQVRVATATATDDDLRDIAQEVLAIETEEARLLERTHSRLRRAIPEAKALRYLQLETKLLALARYEAAAALP